MTGLSELGHRSLSQSKDELEMNIPTTINAYAVALADLGHHVYLGTETGQITRNLPIDGLQAFIRANHEYESTEATFLIPGLVSDEMTALALISALQQSSTGLCRFVVSEGQIQAKASLLVGEFLTAARLQAWWRRSLDEVEQWYAQALAYSIISSSNTTSVPARLQPQGEVLDIFSDVASPDAQKCESVTAERVEMCMARLTGVMPETRMAGNFQVVETSIGGQFLDIEVAENELRFTIGSSLNNQHPALSTALAQAINQLHVFEPAPTAFVLDSGEHVELYTRAVVDTSVGLDDQALLNAIQKWGPYVYDFNERIFAQLQG